ncbi:hypothetical protein BTJ68_11544 [Hortaea werneckii EXF-2000]|uniref:BZIP domain-containing protein n=1 Tax=Hortaea werneckii EXF-2000 TaxID=1157616 RepID=A0A1Z5T073_HORWE|nr:hypothetical protein BTJ68_11544 [Hortaea werneckii EXF-2000]
MRNRLSQQAFRRRQATYIQELEKRVELAGRPEDERVVSLEGENRALRKQLQTIHSRINGLRSSLDGLSLSVDEVLSTIVDSGRCGSGAQDRYTGHKFADLSDLSCAESRAPEIHVSPNTALDSSSSENGIWWDRKSDHDGEGNSNLDVFTDLVHTTNSSGNNPHNSSTGVVCESFFTSPLPTCTDWVGNSIDPQLSERSSEYPTSVSCLPPTLQGTWSHQYQMGPNCYLTAIDNCQKSVNWTPSNSRFSDHIATFQQCLWRTWAPMGSSEPHKSQTNWHRISVSMMLSMFQSLNRPLALSYYTSTKFYDHLTSLTMWQMSPSTTLYSRLHPRYRPSGLQLTETYPKVIDWCPFPTIRDRLILFHAANSQIDQIICDIATAYVVETDLSALVQMDEPLWGYVRVWDLVQAMTEVVPITDFCPTSRAHCNAMPTTDHTRKASALPCVSGVPGKSLPAATASALFGSKDLARLAFDMLGMGEDIAVYKLDPEIFERYPELYEAGTDIRALGTCLSPNTRTSFPTVPSLDHSAMAIYQNFALWLSALRSLC